MVFCLLVSVLVVPASAGLAYLNVALELFPRYEWIGLGCRSSALKIPRRSLTRPCWRKRGRPLHKSYIQYHSVQT